MKEPVVAEMRTLFFGSEFLFFARIAAGVVLLPVVAILTAGCSGFRSEEFVQIQRASKEIEGYLGAGTSLTTYQEKIRKLSTEVEVARAKSLSKREAELLEKFEQILEAHLAAEEFWKASNSQQSIVRDLQRCFPQDDLAEADRSNNAAIAMANLHLETLIKFYMVMQSGKGMPLGPNSAVRLSKNPSEPGYAVAYTIRCMERHGIKPQVLVEAAHRYEIPLLEVSGLLFSPSEPWQVIWAKSREIQMEIDESLRG